MVSAVCVFCGSSSGRRPSYRATAEATGRLLARRGITMIYGGGNVGLMGATADACLAAGGHVIGVIPQSLVDREVAHHGLSELRVTGTMHERKALMSDLADAFMALPGGFGTFEELFEVLTWAQLGIQRKPAVLVNADGYFDSLLAFARHAVQEGFLREVHSRLMMEAPGPEAALDMLDRAQLPPLVGKWTDGDPR